MTRVIPWPSARPHGINYHRFWAEGDIAMAMTTFACLFPSGRPLTRYTSAGTARRRMQPHVVERETVIRKS
jgi:hypothetical protein